MPATAIAAILLRLYALTLFTNGLVQTATVCTQIGSVGIPWYAMTPALAGLIVGVFLWFVAAPFSRFLAARQDNAFRLEGLSTVQLYSAVFLGIGLWFSLSSFAGVFNWIHYFAVNRSSPNPWEEVDGTNLYSLTQEALTFAAGLFFVFTGPIWAVKLAKRHHLPADPAKS
jgi:hypothetical protein